MREKPNFYGRRRSRPLKPQRQRLMCELLPRLAVPAGADPGAFFDRPVRAVWLEIGFGGGEHLAGQAARHPDIGFIGCEPFIDGVASLLRHVASQRLGNIRVHADDARLLLPRLVDGCLERAFLLFPDPWPKNRHAARRFIGPQNLALMARLLKDGAEFRVASDDMNYIRWTLTQMHDHADFEWLAERAADWRSPPTDWVQTRYERKARAQGKACHYLRFRRRPRAGAGVDFRERLCV